MTNSDLVIPIVCNPFNPLLATQSAQSQRSLPPVSYLKAIDVWMSSCTVFVFMSLMEFAVVNHFMGPTVATKLARGYSEDNLTEVLTKVSLQLNKKFLAILH